MDWAATKSYGETDHIACDCGSKLEVKYVKQNGHNENEKFECPKCGKEHSVMASMSIKQNDIVVK